MSAYAAEVAIHFRADARSAVAGVNQTSRALRGLGTASARLRAGLLGMTTQLMGSGAALVGAGLVVRSAIRNYERFSNAQATIRSVLASTGNEIRHQGVLMEAANVSARQWGFGLGESSEAMGNLLEAGWQVHEATRLFGTASRFARASNTDLNQSLTVMTSLMRQFNELGEEGAEHVLATINVAARVSATSVSELMQSLRYAGVELSSLGYNAQETASALGAMSAIGLRGTTAGTRMRGALMAMNRVTATSRNLARDFGIEEGRLDQVLWDSAGNRRELGVAMLQLGRVFHDLPHDMARAQLATSLFGRRAYAAGVILAGLHPRTEEYGRILGQLSDREAIAAQMTAAAEERMRGFGAQMNLARQAVERLGISFMQMLLGVRDDSREGFGQYLSDLTNAILLSREADRVGGQAREQWEELPLEMRVAGAEWRGIMEGWVEIIKWIGKAGVYVARFVGQHRELSVYMVIGASLMKMMFGGTIINAIGLATRAVSAGAIAWGEYSAAVGIARAAGMGAVRMSWGMRLGIIGIGLAVLYAGQQIANAYGRAAVGAESMERQQRRATEALGEFGTVVGQIPVLGQFVTDITSLVQLTQDYLDVTDTLAAQRRTAEEKLRTPATSEIYSRAALTQMEGESVEESRARIAGQYLREQMMNQAAVLRRNTYATEEAALQVFQAQARRAGVGHTEIGELSPMFLEEYRRMTPEYGRSLYTALDHAGFTPEHSFEQAVAALRAGREYGLTLPGEQAGVADPAAAELEAARAAVRPLTDVNLSRANQIELARRMALGPAASNVSPLSTPVGAPTVTTPTTTDVNMSLDLNIPVQIDGREVARAAGRYNLNVDQRRGVSGSPGDRVRIAGSGVRR